MKQLNLILSVFLLLVIVSCSGSDSEDYVIVDPVEEIPDVSVEPDQEPYAKLSDYHFFVGNLKNLKPNAGVEPFRPSSELFTDYAHKQRFIWMPENVSANYVADDKPFDMPIGTVLIKNFYYNYTYGSNDSYIIETRLMIKKDSGWSFANYVWNDGQTEAHLNTNGLTLEIDWKADASGPVHNTAYKVPSLNDCMVCHRNGDDFVPIGFKPQNLNSNYAYENGTRNQINHLRTKGYIQNVPNSINSTIDFKNTQADLQLRVRSYFDINCAHCHIDGGNAAYSQLRFAFAETSDLSKMGLCVTANLQPEGTMNPLIINGGNAAASTLPYLMQANDMYFMMPRIGRTMVHQEAVDLVNQWIGSLPACE